MDTKKFRVVPCLLFTLAALLTVLLASVAQAQTAAEESVSSAATSFPPVTTFHFTDKGDDRAGRMTADAAGNFDVSASLDDHFGDDTIVASSAKILVSSLRGQTCNGQILYGRQRKFITSQWLAVGVVLQQLCPKDIVFGHPTFDLHNLNKIGAFLRISRE